MISSAGHSLKGSLGFLDCIASLTLGALRKLSHIKTHFCCGKLHIANPYAALAEASELGNMMVSLCRVGVPQATKGNLIMRILGIGCWQALDGTSDEAAPLAGQQATIAKVVAQ